MVEPCVKVVKPGVKVVKAADKTSCCKRHEKGRGFKWFGSSNECLVGGEGQVVKSGVKVVKGGEGVRLVK